MDDLLINASATAIDGVNGILGQAGPDAFRSGSRLPYHGIMEFDSADMASMEQSGLLLSVVMHEMGHILGIGTIWSSRGLLSGAGTSNPIFVGAQATAAYNQIFGTSASGVPVENTGGSGTRDSHWRDSILVNELMTGWAGPGTNLPLSRITVGSLADIGYTVNYAAADSYTPSSSSLAAARQAAGSSSAAVRLVGLSATTDWATSSVSTAGISQYSPAVHPRRLRPLPVSHTQPIDAELADAALADAWHSSDDATTETFCHPETQDSASADLAWAELASDWNLWPALALA